MSVIARDILRIRNNSLRKHHYKILNQNIMNSGKNKLLLSDIVGKLYDKKMNKPLPPLKTTCFINKK